LTIWSVGTEGKEELQSRFRYVVLIYLCLFVNGQEEFEYLCYS
jgi:hypothetical protein